MSDYQLLLLAGFATLLLLDFVTVAARSAMVNAVPSRLGTRASASQADNGRAENSQRNDYPQKSDYSQTAYHKTLTILESSHVARYRTSLFFANDLLRFSLAGMAFAFLYAISPLLQPYSLPWIIAALLIAALLISWAEWAISEIVAHNPEEWVMRMFSLIQVYNVLMFPFAALALNFTSGSNGPGTVTEDELKSMVDASQQEGLLEQEERQMIYSIFELGDTLVREIMVPRIDMMALDVMTTFDQAADALLKSGHSRVPVYEESIDNVLGVLYTKDLLRVWRRGEHFKSLRDLLRPAYFVPEAKKLDELLDEMQSKRVHIAIIVDEYGGVAGLVTLEDIVEEIVGEIQDEYDQAEELPYQKVQEGEYIFQGKIDLDTFNEVMHSLLPSSEAETLGGYIYSRMGRAPSSGESVRQDNLLLTVEQVSGRRIRKIRAQWLPTDTTPADREANLPTV